MHHDELPVRPLRNEMIRQPLEPWPHFDAQLVDARQMGQAPDRAWDISNYPRQVSGKSFRPPEVSHQHLALVGHIAARMQRDCPIINQGLRRGGRKQQENRSDHPYPRQRIHCEEWRVMARSSTSCPTFTPPAVNRRMTVPTIQTRLKPVIRKGG